MKSNRRLVPCDQNAMPPLACAPTEATSSKSLLSPGRVLPARVARQPDVITCAIVIRRSPHSPDVHAQRRATGGARREATERILLRATDFEAHGWTLNVSRGGMRVIVEEPVKSGLEYELVVGDADGAARKVTVVWVQEEADGQIVGVKFLDSDGSIPPQD